VKLLKRAGTLILVLIILLFSVGVFAEEKGDVYVIPIKGEINKASYNYLNSTLKETVKKSPTAIIFEIDTYGGLIDEAEKIKNLIIDLKVPTISFVNTKAESAGVLITISSEKVVMAKSSTIGSAETIPNTEKILSMWKSLLRDVAQYRGRDAKIIEGMADKNIYGKLINLTGNEALEEGVCDLISNDYREMLEYFNIPYNNVVKLEENLELKLARTLANPYMGTLLLTIGFIGMVIEIFTPGFGVGGTISIIAFGLFFGGNIIAGHSQWTSLIVFVTGLILLVIEAIIPGFGLPGISGIILVLAGTVLAMGTVTSALLSLSIAIIITAIITIVLIKFGHKNQKLASIILNTSQKDNEGYLSATTQEEYLDKKGISISELRPSGVIEIDGRRVDALSEGVFIPKGSEIKVIRVEGSKIIVRRI
jgi:membrane-bound serine protease (ClpP class)